MVFVNANKGLNKNSMQSSGFNTPTLTYVFIFCYCFYLYESLTICMIVSKIIKIMYKKNYCNSISFIEKYN